MKVVATVSAVGLLLCFLGCASRTPDQTAAYDTAAPALKQKTPRFSDLDACLAYLWTAVDEEIYHLRSGEGFSAVVSESPSEPAPPLSAEDETRLHAQQAMDALDQEIARQEGRSGGSSVTVSAGEQYTSGESTQDGGKPPADRPMVIAVADFVNEDGTVSKLGRYIADRITPYFARSRQFSVLERHLINKVVEEQAFQVSALVNESSGQAFGELLGAEAVVAGKVSELSDRFYLLVRVVSVSRGDILVSVDAEVDKDGRLAALYQAALPKPVKPAKPRIFRAKGVGVPSHQQQNPTLARTLAARAAQADAMRNLAQEIQGAQVDSQTTVKDFMTQSDVINVQVNTFLRGARVIDKRELPDGAVEVTMEVEVPGEFFDGLY